MFFVGRFLFADILMIVSTEENFFTIFTRLVQNLPEVRSDMLVSCVRRFEHAFLAKCVTHKAHVCLKIAFVTSRLDGKLFQFDHDIRFAIYTRTKRT